jgi:hypothetical protein
MQAGELLLPMKLDSGRLEKDTEFAPETSLLFYEIAEGVAGGFLLVHTSRTDMVTGPPTL